MTELDLEGMAEYIVVGIDFSYTSTGIFVANTHSGMVSYKTICTQKDEERPCDQVSRAMEIAGECLRHINFFKEHRGFLVDMENVYVYIEGLAFGNSIGNASRDLAGLQYTIISYLINDDFLPENIRTVAPTSLKKFATKNGKADKKMMFDAIPDKQLQQNIADKYKISKGRYDIADAFWLFAYGRTELIHDFINSQEK